MFVKRASGALSFGPNPPNVLHLPNGINVTVTNVFGGFYFKVHELNTHHGAFPPGWTIVIHSEDDKVDLQDNEPYNEDSPYPRNHAYRFKKPTLHNDALFISSISNPSNSDFKPAVSPSRQIAMMLWATLWWYFHQPQPSPLASGNVDLHGARVTEVKDDWRLQIKRDGIFKGRHLLSKMERMGLIASEHSYVGLDPDDGTPGDWADMFVSQRSFWQIDARIFLFTLSPTGTTPYPGNTPYPSRPSSPNREGGMHNPRPTSSDHSHSSGLWSPTLPGPFSSPSHLPTYYPQPPPQYITSEGVRHPLRPKPPRQGETFYTRYVPSIGQYLSFRAASLSSNSVQHKGPISATSPSFLPPHSAVTQSSLNSAMTSLGVGSCDTELLHRWMNEPRVSAAWGVDGPREKQEDFLRANLINKHSFPVIGCWDGRPFGYFEMYWVKEDQLGRSAGGIGDYDRGFHMLVGEQEFRGPHRVKVWMSALVHACWLADQRTDRVFCEPRLNNTKVIKYLQEAGFTKEGEVTMPHKQAALMRINRGDWENPCL